MSGSSLHVLIVGGGLGGLCLAQGLQQAGVSVTVYERDVTPAIRRQGYRLHIDARGANALRSCLPSHLFELFTATASPPGHQITVLNKHLSTLRVIGSPGGGTTSPAPFSAGVDRLTLREILLAGLDGIVSFGKEFSKYELQEDGRVQAFFSDGTVACGDVLVAADGVNSRLRQQFLPGAAVVDTGARCIYGKVELAEAIWPLVPDVLHHGLTVAVSRRLSMALGLIAFRCPPALAAQQLAPSVQFHTSGSYLMWSLNARRAQVASDEALFRMDGTALRQLVLKQVKSWHPNLRALIAASDPAELFPIAVRVAVPCKPWQSTPVTLLGDAIHAMSPAGGSGANVALLDARLLCETLISIAHGERPLLQAIHAYEARMLKGGFEAVRFSTEGGVLAPSAPVKRSVLQALFRGPRSSS